MSLTIRLTKEEEEEFNLLKGKLGEMDWEIMIKVKIFQWLRSFGETSNDIRDQLSLFQAQQSKLLGDVVKLVHGTSGEKGKVSEATMAELISSLFPEFEVIEQGGKSRRTDLQVVTDEGTRILVEVKNYKNNVGSAEVAKFYRDLDANRGSFDIGIFVSLSSGIVRKPKLSWEYYGEIPICFSPNTGLNPVSIQSLFIFVQELHKMITKKKPEKEVIELKKIQGIWDSLDIIVEDIKEKMLLEQKLAESLLEYQASSFKTLGDCYRMSLNARDNISKAVGKLREEIQGKLRDMII